MRRGGKVPAHLFYNPSTDPILLDKDVLVKQASIGARMSVSVPIKVEGDDERRQLRWWWRCDSGDLDFQVLYYPDKGEEGDGKESERIHFPKMRLLTEFVPDRRTVGDHCIGFS